MPNTTDAVDVFMRHHSGERDRWADEHDRHEANERIQAHYRWAIEHAKRRTRILAQLRERQA